MISRRIALLAVAVLTLTSCGENSSKTTQRPLTQQEASTLSQASFTNYDIGGALFEVNTVTEPNGPQLRLRGRVDWKTHSGSANVLANIPSPTLAGVWWQKNAVMERRPTFDTAILAATKVKDPVLVRRPETTRRRLDQVIAVLTGLAAEQAENAQLVLQMEGSAFLRTDELRGRAVDVMRYGQRSIFWIDSENGRMLRFEGTNKLGNQPIIVDIVKHEAQKIQLPPEKNLIVVEGNEKLLSLTNGF
jgi:hypothetical protein